MRAHSLLLPPSPIGPSPLSPSSIPTFLARSRNNHTKSLFFSLTFPPAISFASKNTKGKINSVLRTASFVAKYCFRRVSFSKASFASADFVCAFACTATELEGLKRFFTIVAGSEDSSSSSWVIVVDTPEARALGFTLCCDVCASWSASSSSPNERPIFFTPFLRFLKPAGLGVCSLCLVRQSPFLVVFPSLHAVATIAHFRTERHTGSHFPSACSRRYHRFAQELRRVACGNRSSAPGRRFAL